MTRIPPRLIRSFGACAALAAIASLLVATSREAGAGPPAIRDSVRTIAPGLTLRRIVDLGTPQRTFVLTLDRSQPLTLDVTLALGDHLAGYARTSEMAANAGAIAAVNGDFTIPGGHPYHPFAEDGNLVQTSETPGWEFAPTIDEEGAFFGRPDQSVTAEVLSTGETLTVDRWDFGPPEPGEIAAFSPSGGDAETPPAGACSAHLVPVSPPAPADPDGVQRTYTVDATACDRSPMAVAGGVVLSALPGTDEAIRLLSLRVGEQIRLTWSFGWPGVFDAIGGGPALVTEGRIAVQDCEGYLCRTHPRTGVGITADGQILLVVVDGRQPGYSTGMTMQEFARLFLDLGAVDAMNLDGGGSSTMVVNGEVVNRPSEGVERSVGSAIVVLPGSDPGEVLGVPTSPQQPIAPAGVGQPGRSALLDPGSTGGLLDALARGSFGQRAPLPEDLMRLVRLFRASR